MDNDAFGNVLNAVNFWSREELENYLYNYSSGKDTTGLTEAQEQELCDNVLENLKVINGFR